MKDEKEIQQREKEHFSETNTKVDRWMTEEETEIQTYLVGATNECVHVQFTAVALPSEMGYWTKYNGTRL